MRRGLLALALLGLAAGPATAEGLLDGLPRAHEAASRAMTGRVQALAPGGTPVAGLRLFLEAEGFEPEGATAARREGWGIVCRPVWLVRWTEDGGRVVTIEGQSAGICL